MKVITVMESILNAFDFGIFFETIRNSFKYHIEMAPTQFLRLLFLGKGYNEITPPQLAFQMKKEKILIVDLRDNKAFEKSHIKDSVLHPFDDFIKDILENIKYSGFMETRIILVCRTGNLSRVAGSIMAEAGFLKVYSLKRGMRRWNRWRKLCSFCHFLRLY